MTKSIKIITGILGFFMLMPGIAKFFEPFKTFLAVQIEKSQLPFPSLTYFTAQSSEILTGLILFGVLFFWKKLAPEMANKLFLLGNLLVIPIMLVALYVHLHPDVPAEVLPFESKPPRLTVILLLLTLVNIYLYKTQPKAVQA